MGLRKGGVAVDNQAAAAETPAIDRGTVEAPAPVPAPAPAPQAEPATTEPVAQHETASTLAQQAAPAPAPVATEAAPTQMPATRAAGAVTMTSGDNKVQTQLEDDGFSGLDFGFGSFPMITLQNDGTFQSSEGGSLGTSFDVVLLGSVPKWIFKNDQKGPAEDFFYTFDQVVSTGGEQVAAILGEWDNKGYKYETKKYLDVQAQLVTDDEDNGSLVLLSIPPTSITKFSGYIATVRGRHQSRLDQCVTRVSLGEKVTKVKHPFHPWAFQFLSPLA